MTSLMRAVTCIWCSDRGGADCTCRRACAYPNCWAAIPAEPIRHIPVPKFEEAR